MKAASQKTFRSSIKSWFTARLQGLLFLQLCFAGILLVIMAIFAAYYPAGIPTGRYLGIQLLLFLLLLINLFGINPLPDSGPRLRPILDWSFLIVSALLIVGFVWVSGQFDLVYLLSLVCIQACILRGVRPAGLIFSAGILITWFVMQLALGQPTPAVIAREFSLAVGVILGVMFVTLLNRSVEQRKIAEGLLAELQAAHRELEAAQQKERDLAVAEERVRLSRELHDSVTQSIYSIGLYAEAAVEQLAAGEMETAEQHLQDIRDTARDSLREMRLLIFELHRPVLEKGGLAAAVQARLDAVETRSGVRAELQVNGVERLAAGEQAELYSIAMEALNNTVKHARASHVLLCFRFEEGGTMLEIRDDGVGFTPSDQRARGGFGISGMQERAQKIGGTLQIDSSPGKGTRVSVWVPAPGKQAA